jgi:lysyl-tRNA synthetase class 2
VAERFELYLEGMEVANGFHELTDAVEQQTRFARDHERRMRGGQPVVAQDESLLAALREGMPACAGVALGLDRLLMYLTRRTDIREVLAFSFERA